MLQARKDIHHGHFLIAKSQISDGSDVIGTQSSKVSVVNIESMQLFSYPNALLFPIGISDDSGGFLCHDCVACAR